MSKVIKQMEMDDMKRAFASVRDLVVLNAEHLSAQGEYTLRASLRKKNIRLKQVKNSLCRRVFRELNLSVPDDSPYWAKATIMAWGGSSISELSREIDGELRNPKNAGLYRTKDKGERVKVKGAIVDGSPITFAQALKMPTRLELIGQIVGAITGPGAAIAGCLEGPGAMLASQVKQIAEKKEEEAPAAAS